MINTLWTVIWILLYAILIGFLFIFKNKKNRSLMTCLKKTSIMGKLFILIIVMYTVSLPFQVYSLSKQEPFDLNYHGTSYNDILEVDDGLIVSGSQSRMVNFNDKENHEYGGSQYSIGTLRKYSFDGNLLWEYVYDDVSSSSHFDQVVETDNGNYLVLGRFSSYIKDDQYSLYLTFNQAGELVNELRVKKPDYDVSNIGGGTRYINEKVTDKYIYKIEYNRYRDYESDEENTYLIINQFNHELELLNAYTYTFKHEVSTEYWEMLDVSMINITNNRLFIGIVNFNQQTHDIFLQHRLLEFNLDLTLQSEYKYNENKVITDIQQMNQNYLITWKPLDDKKAYIELVDSAMNQLWEEKIVGNTPYITVNEMIIKDEDVYLLGHEYVNAKQVGFTNEYSGYVMHYNLNTRKGSYHNIGNGIGVDEAFLKGNTIYGAGMLNNDAFFLSNSRYKDDPHKGVISMIEIGDYQTKIKVFNSNNTVLECNGNHK
ncbi:hypothetical protein [Haloplasma contractile]|uniref:Uncharacterized protein n=1 Tax=Haloplasma contractile SSD-17B TaxID=1033810 RepID=F7Q1T4_9MOLU|nr:hypothetical protein [Haloplasma contractile]ERJ12253.1 hypothetical protein HLPCO_001780 [Haloplasma contractile SSD-17B]